MKTTVIYSNVTWMRSPSPWHTFRLTCKIDLKMARDDDDPLLKSIIICTLQAKNLKIR